MTVTFNTKLLSYPSCKWKLTDKNFLEDTYHIEGLEVENLTFNPTQVRAIYNCQDHHQAREKAKELNDSPEGTIKDIQIERNLLIVTYPFCTEQ